MKKLTAFSMVCVAISIAVAMPSSALAAPLQDNPAAGQAVPGLELEHAAVPAGHAVIAGFSASSATGGVTQAQPYSAG